MKGIIYSFIVITLLIFAACKGEYALHPAPDGIDTTTALPPDQQQRKVLIIGINGCRGDAMQSADAPNIHKLLKHSVYSFDSRTKAPTFAGPGWASVLTGVWGNKHGVTDNTFSGNNFAQYPMIFKYIKQAQLGVRTVSIISWSALNDEVVSDADVKISTNNNDEAATDSAVSHLKQDNPDIMFLDYEGVDHEGQQFGFDITDGSKYMESINTVDRYVGDVLKALNSRSTIGKENWLIIITSDHGGDKFNVGGSSYGESNTFSIYYNQYFNEQGIKPKPIDLKATIFKEGGQFAYIKDATNSKFLDFDQYAGFTAQVDVKSDKLSGDEPILTNKNWGSGANPGWNMAVYHQYWQLNFCDGNSHHRKDIRLSSGNPLSDGNWHNIAITVKKSSNEVKLYQDGKLVGASTFSTQSTWNGGSSEIKLVSGEDIIGNHYQKSGKSVFSVANIRVWDTVISEQDMKQYGLSCDTTYSKSSSYYGYLVGWWKGTDGSGNVFKDYGPEGMDMLLSGNPDWVTQTSDLCNNPPPLPDAPELVDVVPAVLQWLKIDINASWGLDGKSWLPD